MNFYFCETCGKRITENDIEAGQARNKKLKGVYCTGCAVGVMTMETLPLSKEEARQILQASREQSRAPSIPHEASGARPPRPLPASDQRQGSLILAGIVGITVIAISMVLVLRSSGPVSAPRREQVATLPAPQVSVEKPIERPVSNTSLPTHAPAGEVQSNKAPVVMLAPGPAVTAVPVARQPPSPETTLPVKETNPALAPPTQGNPAAQPPDVVSVDKGREQFAVILKELAPILKQNRFTAAQDLLESRRRDPAFADAVELIDREIADLAEVKGLRNKAIEALRAKVGTVVTLKKLAMPGTIKTEPNNDGVTLALKNGPELRVSASQLDANDVNDLLLPEVGTGKAADLRRRGLLFLAAGEMGKAEDYLIKARDAGPGEAVAPALERIAVSRLGEREFTALESWKKAESLFASKSWKAAKQSFDAFQREFKGTKTMANNADLLAKRLEAIDETLGPPKEVSLDLGGGVKLDLVLIPAGEFEMGSNDGEKNERPAHKVKITSAFYIGKYATTQAQYEKLMGNNPSNFNGEKLPVEMVAYDAAEEFCKKLSKLTGKTFRLPTEAEWEYACRAGTTTKFNTGNNEAAIDSAAWFQANSEGKTHPVGQKKPNAWGLYDMHGNVWQWCKDWYAEDCYGKSEAENPQGPAQGATRVLRGGAWGVLPEYCRSTVRFGRPPELRDNNIGFRVAASVVKIP